MSLTQSQLADFRRDGFLIVRGMYSPEEVRALSGFIDELERRPRKPGLEMAYYEDSLLEKGKRVLSRIEKFADAHDGFRKFVFDPKMTGPASELIGDRAVLFKEKINFKLPGGGGFEPHQDIQPGWDEYAPFFLSVLVTIDSSTIQNGCLELAAGHHTRGLIGRKWKPLEGAELEGIVFKACPMEPGDVAFFDCFVPHQSKPNLTSAPRRNLYLTYNRAADGDHRERYFADKRKSYPPDNEREPGKQYAFKV
jgi:ectoine hydroxylase-related dioxygenase (phytanoyl-CoA dioxygenase family)